MIFSRDCPQYTITTPTGAEIHVLVNHFKSQSGGGQKRRRQATEVRRIADGLIADGKHVIVMGDLNEGPPNATDPPPNLEPLFDTARHLVACYDLPGSDIGERPGTFNACGLRDRLDYIFISNSLRTAYLDGQIYRKGLWGGRKTRPDKWDTYPEMTTSVEQASGHAAVAITLDLATSVCNRLAAAQIQELATYKHGPPPVYGHYSIRRWIRSFGSLQEFRSP